MRDRLTLLGSQQSRNFNGYERGSYGEADYARQCTDEEWALLSRRFPDALADEHDEDRQADEAERDSYFAALAEGLSDGEDGEEESQ